MIPFAFLGAPLRLFESLFTCSRNEEMVGEGISFERGRFSCRVLNRATGIDCMVAEERSVPLLDAAVSGATVRSVERSLAS